MTCGRTQGFLAEKQVETVRLVDARKTTLKLKDGLALLELDTIQNYRHNPTVYVELAGNALYTPFVLEYADKPARFRHIISRMAKLPACSSQSNSCV